MIILRNCRMRSLVAVLVCLGMTAPSQALVIDDGTNNFDTPINTFAPVGDDSPLNPTATDVFNNFYRVPTNRSAVYLGNQWVITATHAGDPSTVELDGGTFEVVPGSAISLSNPAFNDTILGSPTPSSITSLSDIELFRIRPNSDGLTPEQADPNLPSTPLGIASQTPSVGTPVTFVASGSTRGINTNPDDNIPADSVDEFGITSITNGSGTFQGIPNQGPSVRSFGNNRIASDGLLESGFDTDNVFGLRVVGGRDIIGQLTQFSATSINVPGDDLAETFEAQAAGGDSGGAVFVEENGEIVLAGVLHAIADPPGQPGRIAGFGNLTIFSDLSQDIYREQIQALLSNDFEAFNELTGRSIDIIGFSINGDVNLDGVISGDGTGDPATDDVAAFVAGFGNIELDDMGQLLENGSLESWRQGDLNLDGVTDLADFALLRDAYNGAFSVGQLSSLLAASGSDFATGVPEPTAASLVLIMAGLGLALRRNNRGS